MKRFVEYILLVSMINTTAPAKHNCNDHCVIEMDNAPYARRNCSTSEAIDMPTNATLQNQQSIQQNICIKLFSLGEIYLTHNIIAFLELAQKQTLKINPQLLNPEQIKQLLQELLPNSATRHEHLAEILSKLHPKNTLETVNMLKEFNNLYQHSENIEEKITILAAQFFLIQSMHLQHDHDVAAIKHWLSDHFKKRSINPKTLFNHSSDKENYTLLKTLLSKIGKKLSALNKATVDEILQSFEQLSKNTIATNELTRNIEINILRINQNESNAILAATIAIAYTQYTNHQRDLRAKIKTIRGNIFAAATTIISITAFLLNTYAVILPQLPPQAQTNSMYPIYASQCLYAIYYIVLYFVLKDTIS